MIIAVVDGQGGGIGVAIIKALRNNFGHDLEIWGLGTNAVAAVQMMKAGANKCASGENAIRLGAGRADVLMGTISIVLADSMMGEMTPLAAEAVASSPALKILLPLSQSKVEVEGVVDEPLPHLIEMMMGQFREVLANV
ncbi:MAG: DUF3842 family protein [Deltaproteobacteria bacterium]|nr:DUF3842 family protein [Deltaproteobacteria bacterium]